MKKFAKSWANDIKFSYKDRKIIKILRKFGCECYLPLFGERQDIGPRCRLCDTQGHWK